MPRQDEWLLGDLAAELDMSYITLYAWLGCGWVKGERGDFVTKLNKTWHEKNKMPRNASIEERINWHIAHARNCACRPIPDKLKLEIENRKKPVVR